MGADAGDGSIRCPQCGMDFPGQRLLDVHIGRIHSASEISQSTTRRESSAIGPIDHQVIGQRLVATVVDLVLLAVLVLATAYALGPTFTDDRASQAIQLAWRIVHYIGLALVYYSVSEAITGTTPGKMLLGLKVVKLDGSSYGLKAVLIRNLLRIVDGLPLLYIPGIIIIRLTEKRQRLGDLAAGTQVVRIVHPTQAPSRHSTDPPSARNDSLAPTDARWKLSVLPKMAVSLLAVALISTISILASPQYADPSARLVYAGNQLVEEGRFREAISEYDEAVRLDPEFALAYANRGLAYDSLGQYERAIRNYDEAVRRDPQMAVAYNDRGLAYFSLDQHQRAIQDFDEAIRLDPKDALAYANRGFTYFSLSQHQQAIQDFDEAIRLDRQLADPYVGLAVSYTALGNDTSAQEMTRRAIELGTDSTLLLDAIEELQRSR